MPVTPILSGLILYSVACARQNLIAALQSWTAAGKIAISLVRYSTETPTNPYSAYNRASSTDLLHILQAPPGKSTIAGAGELRYLGTTMSGFNSRLSATEYTTFSYTIISSLVSFGGLICCEHELDAEASKHSIRCVFFISLFIKILLYLSCYTLRMHHNGWHMRSCRIQSSSDQFMTSI